MPIHYDIETDGLYLEGIEIGIKKGIEKGIEKGIGRGLHLSVQRLMVKFPEFSDAYIADILETSIELVRQVRADMDSRNS
ncbi:MAG TPA: hypothetical protein PKE06_03955 [Flavilitoribacter sp.]|nr:hypothetical protein [Flavilitoribacter sp.]HMQ88372.1 hypothetical protein [Flavilitoribacter sp.]